MAYSDAIEDLRMRTTSFAGRVVQMPGQTRMDRMNRQYKVVDRGTNREEVSAQLIDSSRFVYLEDGI